MVFCLSSSGPFRPLCLCICCTLRETLYLLFLPKWVSTYPSITFLVRPRLPKQGLVGWFLMFPTVLCQYFCESRRVAYFLSQTCPGILSTSPKAVVNKGVVKGDTQPMVRPPAASGSSLLLSLLPGLSPFIFLAFLVISRFVFCRVLIPKFLSYHVRCTDFTLFVSPLRNIMPGKRQQLILHT